MLLKWHRLKNLSKEKDSLFLFFLLEKLIWERQNFSKQLSLESDLVLVLFKTSLADEQASECPSSWKVECADRRRQRWIWRTQKLSGKNTPASKLGFTDSWRGSGAVLGVLQEAGVCYWVMFSSHFLLSSKFWGSKGVQLSVNLWAREVWATWTFSARNKVVLFVVILADTKAWGIAEKEQDHYLARWRDSTRQVAASSSWTFPLLPQCCACV